MTYSPKQRACRALPLLVLACLLFLSIGKSMDDLRRSLTKAVLQPGRVWNDWKTEWSGESDVLPPSVNDALFMMRAHKVSRYALSPTWNAGRFPVQRLVEGGFPARPATEGADFYVGVKGDGITADCHVVQERGEVFLAACP